MKTNAETPPGFENAETENYYEDYSKVHIEAIYEDGEFIDQLDQSPVRLANLSRVKIVALKKDVLKDQRMKFVTQRRPVLPAGTLLSFRLFGTNLEFQCQLEEDLIFVKDGNKPAKAQACKCLVMPSPYSRNISFEPFSVPTLNQVYFQISKKFKPDALSHSINIYNSFFVEGGRPLSSFRFGNNQTPHM